MAEQVEAIKDSPSGSIAVTFVKAGGVVLVVASETVEGIGEVRNGANPALAAADTLVESVSRIGGTAAGATLGGSAGAVLAAGVCVGATGGTCGVVILGAGVVAGAVGGGVLADAIVNEPLQSTLKLATEQIRRAHRAERNLVKGILEQQVMMCRVFGCD